MTETPAESRARLLAEQARAAREKLIKSAPAVSPFSRAALDVVAVQAEMTARMATAIPAEVIPKAAAAKLPAAARAAAGLRVENPKIWSADLKPIRGRVDKAGWLTRVRELPRQPLVMPATLLTVASSMAYFLERGGRGYVRVTHEDLAKAAQLCIETVRKAVRALEANGLLDTFNVLVRVDGEVRRAANAYGLRGFMAAVGVVADAVASKVTGAADRMTEQLRRYAVVWGLKPRQWGLNATPARWVAAAPS